VNFLKTKVRDFNTMGTQSQKDRVVVPVTAILVNDPDCSSANKEMLTKNSDPDSIALRK
jgi:hypothetical protein